MAILKDLHSAQVEIERLKAQLANARESDMRLSYKVSAKGAMSAYGLGRWPVTLYVNQWERLFEDRERALAFIASNRGMFSIKTES